MIKPAIPDFHRDPEMAREDIIDLSRNERVTPFPEWFKKRIMWSITDDLLTKYPDQIPLKRKLAKSLGVSEDMILLTNGADAAIKAVFQAYMKPDSSVAMLDPSYAMYEVYAKMFGCKIQKIKYNEDRNFNSRFLHGLINSNCLDLMLFANPNQPTGTFHPSMEPILTDTRNISTLLVLDETYFDFSGFTVLPYLVSSTLGGFPNLIIIRSFSKGAGIAGLRLGYVIAHPKIISNLARVRSCYDVNSMALMVGELILDHPEIVEEHVREVKEGAEVLAKKARALGLEPILPVVTNFMLIRFPHQVDRVVKKLKDGGYKVKGPFQDECLKNMIRVTLGPPALMEEFGEAL